MFFAFAILFVMAVAVRVPLERMADPTDTSYIPRPEWYFLFLFQILKVFEGPLEVVGTVVLPTLAILALILTPFIDRSKVVRVRQRTLAAGIVDTYLLKSVVAKDFAPDVSAAEQALLFATQSPTSLAALGQPSTAPAWKTIPSWDVVGRQDKIIPEAAQLMMAHRAGSHITEINSSHVSLISHPAEVAAVILKAACATG